MKLIISSAIVEKFPDTRIGGVVARGLESRPEAPALLSAMKEEARSRLLASGLSTEKLTQHPHIAAWRRTYQGFGVKAKKHKPTAEALVRRILKGEQVPSINPAVDAYLCVQLGTMLPVGGYDLGSLEGDVRLEISPGGEAFTALGGAEEETAAGEVVYRDASRVLTRRWNYRDCDPCKITSESRAVVLVAEAADAAIPDEALSETVDGLSAALEQLFRGEVRPFQIIAREQSEIELP